MNCGNLWMGRIIRLWSVTRSGLESWLSCRGEGSAQGLRWLGLAVSFWDTVRMVDRLLNTPALPFLALPGRNFPNMGEILSTRPWGGLTAAAGPEKGPYLDNSGPAMYPSILRVPSWSVCSWGGCSPLCCFREKVPPSTCQSPWPASLSMQGDVNTRPPEAT